MRERLGGKPSAAMCEYVFKPRIDGDKTRSFRNMIWVNQAHTLMLHKQGIIDCKTASKILRASCAMLEAGPESVTIRLELEDLYYNIEQSLIETVGGEIGGRLHTARSRNDLYATVLRMNARDALTGIYDKFLKVRDELLNLAGRHFDTVMTGYTHLQPAQPTTLAHYLIGVSSALSRDYLRLQSAYERLNLSPLGSAAFAGTSFDIDRSYTAEILGFDGIVINTLDAVASRDYFLELAYGFCSLGSTLSRLAYDLHLWCSDEFSYIELDDSLSGSSSIMPQKKNPTSVEHIKAKASHLLGSFVSIFSCLKNIPFGHCKDSGGECPQLFWEAVKQIEAMLVLTGEVVRTSTVKVDAMASRVNVNFCTATDLADALVRVEGMPFRTAHQIVGSLVAQCHADGLTMNEICPSMLDEKAAKYFGRTLNWSTDEINATLGATNAVGKRKTAGGPSKAESERVLALLREGLLRDKEVQISREESLKKAESRRECDINYLLTTEV